MSDSTPRDHLERVLPDKPSEEQPAKALVALTPKQLARLAPEYVAMVSAIERCEAALALCETVDETRKLKNQAQTLQKWFHLAKDDANEICCSRVRVRAERKGGQILRTMGESGGRQRRGGNRVSKVAPRDIAPKLADLGISRDDASRAMQLAALTDEQFEAYLAEPRIAETRRILDEHAARAALDRLKRLGAFSRPREPELEPESETDSEGESQLEPVPATDPAWHRSWEIQYAIGQVAKLVDLDISPEQLVAEFDADMVADVRDCRRRACQWWERWWYAWDERFPSDRPEGAAND